MAVSGDDIPDRPADRAVQPTAYRPIGHVGETTLRKLRSLLIRHEPSSATLAASVKAGLGGLVGIGVAGAMAASTGIPFLLAPFGATAVLVFSQPQSPLAQPINVVGGYLASLCVTIALGFLLPGEWWAAALGVGLVIMLMSAFRVTHPPAGAIPIVAMTSPLPNIVLVETVMSAGIVLVLLAVLHHRIPPRRIYPRPIDQQ